MRNFTERIVVCFFFVSLSILSSVSVFAQYFPARIYKDQQGLLSNRLSDIVQLPNKEIWFGSENGIATYDGLNWGTVPDSLTFIPKHGRVKIKPLADSGCYIIGMREDRYTLARKKGDKWEHIELPNGFLDNGPYFSYSIDSNSEYPGLILTFRNEIYIYTPSTTKWQTLVPQETKGDLNVRKAELVGDSLILATDRGLYSYEKQSGQFKAVVKDLRIENFLHDPASGRIYLLGEDWLGYYKEGSVSFLFENRKIGLDADYFSNLLLSANTLYYSLNSPLIGYDLQTGKQQMILAESFDKDYTCVDATIDHENNLWVVTMRGGFKIYNSRLYYYDKTQLLEDEVTAVLEASNGDLFLGSNSGFQILKASGEIIHYPFDASYFQPRVMDIVEYKGAIYMAANTLGIVKYENGRVDYQRIHTDQTRVIDLEVHDGKLHAANSDEVYTLEARGWKKKLVLKRNKDSFIRKIFLDGEHTYLLTVNGVYDLKRNSFIPAENIEVANVYTAIRYRDSLYFGTKAGLATVVDEELRLIDPKNTYNIYSLLVDQHDHLWIGTEYGIFNYSHSSQAHLSKANGLTGNEVNRNAFTQLKDGRILIGTDEGLSVLQGDHTFSYPIPETQLMGLTINGEPISDFELAHDQNNLRFYYRAISYFNEDIVNYRVRLEGFEENWQELPFATQRSVSYPNLKPGKYRFHAEARVANGPWGPVASSPLISITPAYYNTAWFKVLAIISLGGLFLLIFFLRNDTLNRRNKILTERVAEKTKALHSQNDQLLATINDLKTAQGQLIQSEKLASMGLLTAGIAHEMNNPLNYIRGGAECLKKNLMEINELHNHLATCHENDLEKAQKDYEYLIKESNQLIESILGGAEKSTNIVKSLSSFTADSQSFYSFVDLEQEVETALSLLSNQIGLHITINRMFSSIPKIECYPARINQLLVNILLNATQAIGKTGEITIRIYRRGDEHVGLEVSDNGEGASLDNPNQVFEPFFTTKDKNPGLGLTIARSIVQDHKGDVTFISKKGIGSKIKVKLPIYQTFHPELV